MNLPKRIFFLFLLGLLAAGYFFLWKPSQVKRVYVGVEKNTPQILAERKTAQLKTLPRFKVFADFKFEDRIRESGISYRHNIVDESGIDYKTMHYDHGSGVAVADVDGDGLLDIYFVNQGGPNALYRNLGNSRFEDITERAGVALENKISVSAAFGDIDNDGDQDLYVTTIKMGNALFENQGNGTFRDISGESGAGYVGHSSGPLFLDYNLDGLLDIFVANIGNYTTDELAPGGYYSGREEAFFGHLYPELSEKSVLFENLGGNKFAEVSKDVGLEDISWSGDASFVDFNNDKYPDIYIVSMQGDDHYYESQAGKRFVDRTEFYFPKTPWGAMGVKFFDYDNDGLLDLYVTDMHSDMSYIPPWQEEKKKSEIKFSAEEIVNPDNNIFGNAFYRNIGGRFEEVSDKIGAETFVPWGPSVEDFNADGFLDIFVTAGMSYPDRYEINNLLLNNGGEFLDSEFILGIEPRKNGEFEKEWFRIDCRGKKRHRRCPGKGLFSIRSALSSRSSVIFDVDNDGDLDIVTNEFNSEPQVLLSNLAEKKQVNYLKIVFRGERSNKNGLGARVILHAGGQQQTRFNDGKSGYLSQSQLPLYFGLGDSSVADKIEVIWPSGIRQAIKGPIEANRTLTVTEAPGG